tara:strand:- start:65 stop:214 length:150 start_codon:yes stop_codon:yes gene_type:complete
MTKLEIKQLKKELNWFREYAHYIGQNHWEIDAEAASYADGDYENWNDES